MKLRISLLLICALLLAGCSAPAAPEVTAPTLPVFNTEPAPETVPVIQTTLPVETETEPVTEPTEDPVQLAREWFYHVFWELDPDETEAWFAAHPEYLENGYEGVSINEAWLSDNGLDLYTTQGHQVLAIDAENRILILRATLAGSRTVMAIAKLPDRLHLYPSAGLGSYGEVVGTIAERHNGLLAMTGSGFIDPDGNGNGGQIAGWCMCGGERYGSPMGYNYFRFELGEDNWFTVTRATGEPMSTTTDAMEFEPALLIGGETQPPGIWTGENPRACIGQTERGEILMLGVEGRFSDSPGCSVVECAKLMQSYGGINAINVDGGTTAILWYRGQPIMRCSNRSRSEGRYLPNAWVYVNADNG